MRVAERVARAQQEVLGPAFGLEAEHVGAEHPAQQLLADRRGEHPQEGLPGEGRVREVRDPRVGLQLS